MVPCEILNQVQNDIYLFLIAKRLYSYIEATLS